MTDLEVKPFKENPSAKKDFANLAMLYGAGAGVALGAGVGAALGDIALGAGVGTALGAAAGTAFALMRGGKKPK